MLFDHDGDGVKTGTGWLLPDDAWLARDLNGNGSIDTGKELFGVDTTLRNGTKATNGFHALAELDDNNDGRIDALDSAFNQLRVWRDLNQDGISQANELLTLDQAGLVAIETAAKAGQTNLGNGNIISATGRFIRKDGTSGNASVDNTGAAANLDLAVNSFHRKFTDAIPLTDQAKNLNANLKGAGMVRDLKEAISLSPALGNLVSRYMSASSREEQQAKLDELMTAWTNTSTLKSLKQQADDLKAQGHDVEVAYHFDGLVKGSAEYDLFLTRLAVVERFMGFTYAGPNGGATFTALTSQSGHRSVTLTREQIANINLAYARFKTDIYESLVLGTTLSSYVNEIKAKAAETGVKYDFSTLENKFTAEITTNPRKGALDLIEFISAIGQIKLEKMGWNWASFVTKHQESLLLVGINANEFSSFTFYIGHSDNDTLNGGGIADLILSGTGNDSLSGGGGNDTLIGGIGNDILDGGSGDDTYVLNLGDGVDKISDAYTQGPSADRIQFGTGITADALRFTRVNSDLVVKYSDTDTVTLTNWFSDDGYKVEQATFADGSSHRLASLVGSTGITGTDGADSFGSGALTSKNYYRLGTGNDVATGGKSADLLYGESGNDTLNGVDGEDLLDGGADNDSLSGGGGNDTLIGGIGNDILDGGSGDDTYVLNLGDGVDKISDAYTQGPSADRIQFGTSITADALRFTRVNSDLVVKYSDTDTVTLTNWFSDDGYKVEQVTFADGSTSDIISLLETKGIDGGEGNDNLSGLTGKTYYRGLGGNDTLSGNGAADLLDGGAGNDSLSASGGNDTLIGGIGNDILDGGSGDDTYVLNLGDGVDKISDAYTQGPSADRIQFGTGITADALRFTRVNSDLVVKYSDTDTVTLTNWFSDDGYKVEQATFADGSSHRLASLVGSTGITGTDGADSFGSGALTSKNYYRLGTGNDVATGGKSADLLYGESGNDTLNGVDGEDLLDGGADNDSLSGGGGNDTLIGGIGNDILDGGSGDDTYVLNLGDGVDKISDAYTQGPSADRIQFGTSITADALRFTRVNSDLVVKYSDTDTVTLTNWFSDDGYKVEQVTFADGSTSDIISLLETKGIDGGEGNDNLSGLTGKTYYRGLGGNDTLSGNGAADLLDGGAGNDSLSASGGNDTLIGGIGNDILDGGSGDDTYVLNLGDGVDKISDAYTQGPSADRIQFGTGITADALRFTRVNSDLVVKYSDTDTVTLTNWFSDDGYKVEQATFADGSSHRLASLVGSTGITGTDGADSFGSGALTSKNYYRLGTGNDVATGGKSADLLYGESGNDTLNGVDGEDLLDGGADNDSLSGGGGNDTLIGGIGNDILDGGSGDDTYVLNLGDGVDKISDAYTQGPSADRIQFGTSITADALRFTRVNSDLVVKYSDTDTVTLTNWFSDDGYKVEQVTFADGSTSDIISLLETKGIDGGEGNDNLSGLTGKTYYRGLGGNDTLSGNGAADLLDGGAGNDSLSASGGNDTLIGGIGNDILDGGSGDDTYVLNLGDGVDKISDAYTQGPSADRIQFGTGITADALRFTRVNSDLVVKYSDTDTVTLTNWFSDDGYKVEQATFADGSSHRLASLVGSTGITGTDGADSFGSGALTSKNYYRLGTGNDVATGGKSADLLYGESGNDTLNGVDGEDLLDGGADNDSLSGGGGNDTLIGGIGNDILDGGSGDDTYVLNLGDGVDKISDAYTQGPSADRIQFGTSITADALRFTRVNSDLVVKYSDTDTVTLTNWFSDDGYKVEQVTFADGSTSDIISLLETKGIDGGEGNDNLSGLTGKTYYRGLGGNDTLSGNGAADLLDGGAGNDSLSASGGNDTLIGGIGNDILDGGSGDDTYVLNLGDGVDKISDAYTQGPSADRIQFGTGITADALRFTRVNSDLVVKYSDTDTVTLTNWFSDDGYKVEQVTFADGGNSSIAQLLENPKVSPKTASNTVSRNKRSLDEPEIAVCYRGDPDMSSARQPIVAVCTMGSSVNGVDQQLNAMVSAMSAFAPQGAGVLGQGMATQDPYVPVFAANMM
ncbi:calcium-binding protein [Chitinimonas sp. BJB300]|nr:calcium-binding protein [Chitinimonas sp. BJB300]